MRERWKEKFKRQKDLDKERRKNEIERDGKLSLRDTKIEREEIVVNDRKKRLM